MNIQIGIDGTDHLGFFCPNCDHVMEIKSVNTSYHVSGDKCTYIWCMCLKCHYKGVRKFYWKYDGRFLDNKTNKNL